MKAIKYKMFKDKIQPGKEQKNSRNYIQKYILKYNEDIVKRLKDQIKGDNFLKEKLKDSKYGIKYIRNYF